MQLVATPPAALPDKAGTSSAKVRNNLCNDNNLRRTVNVRVAGEAAFLALLPWIVYRYFYHSNSQLFTFFLFFKKNEPF
ncbi:MAG: hypothetical protein ACOX0A_10860 [Thermoguttaceae bacterium]|jgi:hypothetical protein